MGYGIFSAKAISECRQGLWVIFPWDTCCPLGIKWSSSGIAVSTAVSDSGLEYFNSFIIIGVFWFFSFCILYVLLPLDLCIYLFFLQFHFVENLHLGLFEEWQI